MQLIHWSADKMKYNPNRIYPDFSKKSYRSKPCGLWLSVEEDFGWASWSIGEDFHTEKLREAAVFYLGDEEHVLILRDRDDILRFTKKYSYKIHDCLLMIDWGKVKKECKGLIISSYCWDLRLDPRYFWYYGWDCASACIWDLSAIEFGCQLNEKVVEMMHNRARVTAYAAI